MKRRHFLKTSLAVSTLAGLGAAGLSASAAGKKKEYYELRAYHLKSGASHDLLDGYLQNLVIPTLNKAGSKPIGVFTQQERNGNPANTEARDPDTVFVLIPYPSLEAFAKATRALSEQIQAQEASSQYLGAPKDNPSFDRIDSWLLLAFAGQPRIELSPYAREKKPRMFEIRTYESHSEIKSLKKVEMFNAGEIETMHEVGLGPIFYGQALIGRDLPHLTYMLSAADQAAHSKHWEAFGKHPVWNKLKNDPKYADTVSKIINRFVVPTSYSQI
ncbi:MAG TPA: NIPSNAP family protein [Verrucomicrobiae bacterium]|nr:NIPSNAP family protein [Verrucomicrobiae bacterium]